MNEQSGRCEMCMTTAKSGLNCGRELALAMGIATGGAFTLGIALGLFVWVGIVQAAGWSVALAIGGGIGLLAFLVSLLFLRVPDDEQEQLAAGHFRWSNVGRVLGNRDLWVLGVSFAGLYGAGFMLAQLLNIYVPIVYHVSETTSGLMAAVFTLSAIPGSILGGYFFDRAKRTKLIIIVPWLIAGLGLIIFPFMNLAGVWIMLIVLGGVPYVGFSGWAATPGRYKDRILPEDVATAEGVLLTLAAMGGCLTHYVSSLLSILTCTEASDNGPMLLCILSVRGQRFVMAYNRERLLYFYDATVKLASKSKKIASSLHGCMMHNSVLSGKILKANNMSGKRIRRKEHCAQT